MTNPMGRYNKAIVAILTGAATFLVGFGLIPEGSLSEQQIASIAVVLTGFMTWLVPNKGPTP